MRGFSNCSLVFDRIEKVEVRDRVFNDLEIAAEITGLFDAGHENLWALLEKIIKRCRSTAAGTQYKKIWLLYAWVDQRVGLLLHCCDYAVLHQFYL